MCLAYVLVVYNVPYLHMCWLSVSHGYVCVGYGYVVVNVPINVFAIIVCYIILAR